MTPQGAQLLESYRQAEVRLAAQSLRSALGVWPLLVERGDTARWLAVMLALIRRDRASSAGLARSYMTAYRGVEGAPGRFVPELAALNEEKIISSLMVTGPQALDKAMKRAGLEGRVSPASDISKKAAVAAARATQRHVLSGGREIVDDILFNDPARPGYMRLTDGNPCFFCAMLASRGPVYKDDSFEDSDERFSGAGDHKVHDGCGCQLVPIYGAGIVPLTQFKAYERLWQQTKDAGKSGKDAIRHFRQLHEGRPIIP